MSLRLAIPSLALIFYSLLMPVHFAHEHCPAVAVPFTLSESESLNKINPLPNTPLESSASRILLHHVASVAKYGKLPLSFEINKGQTDAQVKFVSRGRGYSLYLTNREAIIELKRSSPMAPDTPEWRGLSDPNPRLAKAAQPSESKVVHMQLAGANPSPCVVGMDELPGKANYFIGNDPKKWRTNVATYSKVKYEGVYPGVDLEYYGNQAQLEYDFVVAPGVDPSVIRLSFDESEKLRIDDQGQLLLDGDADTVRFQKPIVYQQIGDDRKAVDGGYLLVSANQIAFKVRDYDHSRPLVIDPILAYSTYLGGSGDDDGLGIAVDGSGNAYVTGYTKSLDFPTVNALQAGAHGYSDAFLSKLNSSGSALVYSTYLGGSDIDEGLGIAVDASGNAYVTGYTASFNFPTVNPLQATFGGFWDAFVSKLSPSGSALVYSTYLGGPGADFGYAIAVDASGNAYVTGNTNLTNFPTANPFQATNHNGNNGGTNAFISKINANGSAFVYSTYLGGSGHPPSPVDQGGDSGQGIAVDVYGNAYVVGSALSVDFPTANALQATNHASGQQGTNAFVTKINANGSALIYSTYLGGSTGGTNSGRSIGDCAYGVAVDAAGNAYVTGATPSSDFPTANPLQPTFGGGSWNAFVSKLNASGSALVYSTYLGGGNTYGYGIASDVFGSAFVTGYTTSTNFPTANALQPNLSGPSDVFVSKLNSSGSALVYSTYLGGLANDQGQGIAVDVLGSAYVTGYTEGNFPTVHPLQATFGGGAVDAFVSKIQPGSATTVSLVSSLNPANYGQSITLNATVTPQGSGSPTGTVLFLDGSTQLAQVTVGANGQAQFTSSMWALGSHSITAQYSGDANFGASTSAALIQAVSTLAPLVSISVAPNHYQIAPNGSVQFIATGNYSDGSTQNLTSVATWGSTNPAVATVNSSGLVSGVALGNTSVTASYGGATSNTATIQVVAVPVNPSVQFLGGGTPSLFLELGQAAVTYENSMTGANTACIWTKAMSTIHSGTTINATDSRTGSAVAESGNVWLVWGPGSGSCTNPTGAFNVYMYTMMDAGLSVRCFFEVESSGASGCLQNLTLVAADFGTTGDNLLSTNAPSGVNMGDTAGGIPAAVISALNGQRWFVAGTNIRPEDQKYAYFRALTPCGTVIYGQPFDAILRQSYGLGYTNGSAIIDYYDNTHQFHVLNFNISGYDPITNQPVRSYAVSSVGAQPIIVAVGPTDNLSLSAGGIANANDIPAFVLANFFDGVLGRASDLLSATATPTAPWAVNVLVREPFSGTYDVFEYSGVNNSQFHVSQDQFNCNAGTGVVTNPMHDLSMDGAPANLGTLDQAYRNRVVGGTEMTKYLNLGTQRDQRMGYFNWSVIETTGMNNVKYLTINGVDPILNAYSDGVLPGSGSGNGVGGDPGLGTPANPTVTFAGMNSGDYPIWSVLRVVSTYPVPAGVTKLINNAQNLPSTTFDFVPLNKLRVWHSHFSLPSIAVNTAANGTAIATPGDLCNPRGTSALAEQGGDAGGATVLKQANADFCADYGNTTGLVNKTN